MKRILSLALLAILPACAGTTGLDWCKYSDARRATYTTAIRAADAYAASGQIVPYELAIGRLAAVTALQALDARCPVVVR
jgi:hypothetical protein